LVEQGSKEQRRRALLDQHRRAAAQRTEAGISGHVLEFARTAERHRAHADKLRAMLDPTTPNPKTRRAVKDHEMLARRAEIEATRLQREEVDRRWADGATEETVGLARERGEEVESVLVETNHIDSGRYGDEINVITTKSRPMAIRSGLEHAFAKGHLDCGIGPRRPEALLATGRLYREAVEISIGRTSTSGEGAGGGKTGPQLRIIEAADRLKIMRGGLSPKQVRVLDLVCGADLRVRKAADILSAGFPSTVNALRAGLVIASDNWTDAQRSGIAGRAAARAGEAGAMIALMTPRDVR
jgi:hypothetical protein